MENVEKKFEQVTDEDLYAYSEGSWQRGAIINKHALLKDRGTKILPCAQRVRGRFRRALKRISE